jgi:hypothetical protein
MGLDLGYAMMSGALNLDVTYNTFTGDFDDMDMMSIGATYNVNDDMSVSASQTTYGEGGFNVVGGNMAHYYGENGVNTDSWNTHGNIGHLGMNQSNLSFGGAYAMGDITLGVTMHTITDENDDAYERNAMDISLGYSLSDNAGLSIKYVTDNHGNADDVKYTWVTLNVGL